MNTKELVRLAARLADDKKAENIKVIDLGGLSSLCDYILIATATSKPHLDAVEEEISKKLKEQGYYKLNRDGGDSSLWRVSDYGGFLAHIMTQEARDFYALDKIFSFGKEIEYKEPVKKAVKKKAAAKKPSAKAKPAAKKAAPKKTAAKKSAVKKATTADLIPIVGYVKNGEVHFTDKKIKAELDKLADKQKKTVKKTTAKKAAAKAKPAAKKAAPQKTAAKKSAVKKTAAAKKTAKKK